MIDNIDLLGMAMRRLTKRQQLIVEMRYKYKLTFQEIGDGLSISTKHAQRIFEKSLKKLKKEVKN